MNSNVPVWNVHVLTTCIMLMRLVDAWPSGEALESDMAESGSNILLLQH